MAKVLFVSLLLTGLLCIVLRAAFPLLALGPLLWQFPIASLGLYAFVLVWVPFTSLLPPQIHVTRHGIMCQATLAKRADLSDLKLVRYAPDMARLRVRHGGRRRSYGIGKPVDVVAIGRLLGLPVATVDASTRFARFRAVHETRRRRDQGEWDTPGR